MIYIIGTGRIALEYTKLLKYKKEEFIVIGNSINSVNKFETLTGVKALSGGVEKHWLELNEDAYFINCVGVDKLDEVTKIILRSNPKRILVEKPGFLSINSALNEKDFYSKIDNVFIACNRRFFDSVIKLKKILSNETAISAHFEFNEKGIQIDSAFWNKEILSNWVFANSIHVIDTVFYLIGQPDQLAICKEKNKIEWSPYDTFIGHGISSNNVYFTFNSNWVSPGSWCIEIKTENRCFILNPMEILKCRNVDGSIEIIEKSASDFKPGFNHQLDLFINSPKELLTVKDHISNLEKQKNIYV
jgi:hypothetical protein